MIIWSYDYLNMIYFWRFQLEKLWKIRLYKTVILHKKSRKRRIHKQETRKKHSSFHDS